MGGNPWYKLIPKQKLGQWQKQKKKKPCEKCPAPLEVPEVNGILSNLVKNIY